MSFSQLLVILIGGIMISTVVFLILLFYFRGQKGTYPSNSAMFFARLRQRKPFTNLQAFADKITRRNKGIRESTAFTKPYEPARDLGGSDSQNWSPRPIADLYRRIGKRQKAAGLGFILASVVFLVLSIPLKSVVLEIDSVVSFAVAAILLLKEDRNRVQSRVLNAVVSSLGTTIARLSSKAGSWYLYTPLGKAVSDVVVMGMPDAETKEGSAGVFEVVPPGMGLAELFAREAQGVSFTRESLNQLLPSVIHENFGLAEAAQIVSHNGRVEVLLRKPAIICSCQKDESRTNGVVGCTVSSFLGVLYSFATQRTLSLDRCETDPEEGTWKISMTLGNSAA
ncbi:MAG TPA: hypothetical protein VGR53_09830 [Nitrososphaerales archaeon]|nr:hypothetical protein [Nitrososphaerales archaeon]